MREFSLNCNKKKLLTLLIKLLKSRVSQFLSTEPSVPPPIVRGYNINSTSIVVNWDELLPKEQSGVITGFKVCYKAIEGGFTNGDEICITVSGSSIRNVTLTGLEEFVVYKIIVAAITSVGAGPRSDGVLVRTAEDSKF